MQDYLEETELSSHPFVHLMINEQVRLYEKAKELGLPPNVSPVDFIRDSDKVSKSDKFVQEVQLLFQEVNFKIDRIQQCFYMLEFYPTNISDAWRSPLTRAEYIEQIMEIYNIHSLGLLDRILILYDFVFDLKLKRRERNVKSVISKLEEKDGFPLYAFESLFRDMRRSRNVIAHENRYTNPALIELSLEDSAARDGYSFDDPRAKKFFKILDKKYDDEVKRLQMILSNNDRMLTEKYMPLLHVIEAQYHLRLSLM